MTTTPGSLSRRINAAWVHEGSFILVVDTFSSLPPAPETDNVFAFTNDTRRLYTSKAAGWLEYSQGNAGTDLLPKGLVATVNGGAVTCPAGANTNLVTLANVFLSVGRKYVFTYTCRAIQSATGNSYVAFRTTLSPAIPGLVMDTWALAPAGGYCFVNWSSPAFAVPSTGSYSFTVFMTAGAYQCTVAGDASATFITDVGK